jgi:hypothetical protein
MSPKQFNLAVILSMALTVGTGALFLVVVATALWHPGIVVAIK